MARWPYKNPLPRLPRTVGMVEPGKWNPRDLVPTIQFQKWWQSVTEAVENAQEDANEANLNPPVVNSLAIAETVAEQAILSMPVAKPAPVEDVFQPVWPRREPEAFEAGFAVPPSPMAWARQSTGILFDHFVNAANVGTGEDDLYSDTLTAGQLAANGEKIVAQYGGTFVGDATSTQRLKAYFGGTLIFDTGALGIGASPVSWNLRITAIRVSASVVRCSAALVTGFATLDAFAQYTEVTGLTLANTQILKITGEAAGATAANDQIIACEGFVEHKPAA